MDLKMIVEESISCSEVAKKLGHSYINGNILAKTRQLISDNKCDCSHFRGNGQRYKYKRIEKECPICHENFIALEGHKKEKITCSYSCANTFFRSGPDHGNWNEGAYRTTCFHYHEKKCIICGEENIVEVHHLDGNNANNDAANLIPMCSTHHQYWHSRYKNLVEDKVLDYIKNWLKKK